MNTTTGTISQPLRWRASLKSSRISFVTAGLLLGLVGLGCREPNPAYSKGKSPTDASVPQDATTTTAPDRPSDMPADRKPPEMDVLPRDSGARDAARNDASVDAQDEGSDSQPAAVDGVEPFDGTGVDVLRDAEAPRDLRIRDDGPALTSDAAPDSQTFPDVVEDVQSPPDRIDEPGSVADDASVVILDGEAVDTAAVDAQAVDTIQNVPDVASDSTEGADGPEWDASDDGTLVLDGEAADATLD